MFQSISLNVNNPHFLIMQGMITKVINFKPPETLGMIEEASGTKFYETKKTLALNQMRKKEIKLWEVERLLGEELEPWMAKL